MYPGHNPRENGRQNERAQVKGQSASLEARSRPRHRQTSTDQGGHQKGCRGRRQQVVNFNTQKLKHTSLDDRTAKAHADEQPKRKHFPLQKGRQKVASQGRVDPGHEAAA